MAVKMVCDGCEKAIPIIEVELIIGGETIRKSDPTKQDFDKFCDSCALELKERYRKFKAPRAKRIKTGLPAKPGEQGK